MYTLGYNSIYSRIYFLTSYKIHYILTPFLEKYHGSLKKVFCVFWFKKLNQNAQIILKRTNYTKMQFIK